MKHLKFFVFLCFLTFTVSCGQQKRYIQYKVKKGETMSKIAQKLDMRTKDLIRLNPDVVSEPKANSYLVVPEKKLENFKKKIRESNTVDNDSIANNILTEREKLIEELKEKYIVYEVKKGDTFYNLKKRYSVTRGELLLLNPELKEGLKIGQILKIKELDIASVEDDVFYNDYIEPNANIKAALLLPFKTYKYKNDTLSLKKIFGNNNSTLVNITTDFYLGAQIAVDSLRKQGVDIELNVFDTGKKGRNITKIISEKNLNENDVIIGPLYSEELTTVAANVNIPIVFPVYSKHQTEFNSSNIVKTSADKRVFREALENYFKNNFEEGNIIIVSDNTSRSIQNSNALKSAFSFDTNATSINILTPRNGFIQKARFLELLKPETNNWVVMATTKNILVRDAINSLISLPENTTVKVFTFDKGSVYDEIDNIKLAKLGFTYVSNRFEEETSFGARIFNKQYLKKNKALPSFYATKGFDITYDILIRLASGADLKDTFKQGVSYRVETKFDYRNSKYIAENKGLFIVQYNDDLTLTKLN